MEANNQTSLFDRIGGMPAVEAAVDIFYQKVLADDHIKDFFIHTDMQAQRNKQRAFLSFVLGAKTEYTGKSMRKAHERLHEKGLNASHFDAVIKHLGDTLKELQVPDKWVKEVITIADSTRADILPATQ